MDKLIYARLRSASLIETLVALSIILIMFSLITTLFVEITLHLPSYKKINANEVLQTYSVTTIEQNNYFDEEKTQDGFLMKRKVTQNDSIPNLLSIRFVVLDSNNQFIDEITKLVVDHRE